MITSSEYILIRKTHESDSTSNKHKPKADGFTGYRISSSDKGLELFLKSAPLESIKILPNDKIEFITEFKKCCPNTQIQKFE